MLKSYSTWVRKLEYFYEGKDAAELSTADVKKFLTFLAVKQRVSTSSQNQAFNALLFLFRHIHNFDFGVLTVHDGKGKKDRTVPLPQL